MFTLNEPLLKIDDKIDLDLLVLGFDLRMLLARLHGELPILWLETN